MTKIKKPPDSNKSFIHPLTLEIYTDGSYRPEGNAAFAYLVYSPKSKHILKIERYACRNSTINQMELSSINKALDNAKSDYLVIYSDSIYSILSLTIWYKTWEKNDWKTPNDQDVKNKHLIQEILVKLKSRKYVRFEKVEAHTGNPYNSVVDYLASDLTYKMRDNPNLPDGLYSF